MTSDERTARRFLLAVSLVFLPIFAIPLLLHPYGWARRFGWRDEPETDVGRYFGRCLGAVAVALTGGRSRPRATRGSTARCSRSSRRAGGCSRPFTCGA
jgi:hypothetical protein